MSMIDEGMIDDDVATRCAERMEGLLAQLGADTGADTPDALLRDALGDLRHFADRHGLDFAHEDRAAHEVYLEERAARPRGAPATAPSP